MTVEDLTEKCREVYFCTDDYSHATFITVNGALYNLFLEFSIIAKGNITKETYLSYLYLCRYNMEVALASLNLLLPATKENIEALILGVSDYHISRTKSPRPGLTRNQPTRPCTQSRSPNPPSPGP